MWTLGIACDCVTLAGSFRKQAAALELRCAPVSGRGQRGKQEDHYCWSERNYVEQQQRQQHKVETDGRGQARSTGGIWLLQGCKRERVTGMASPHCEGKVFIYSR